MSSLPPDAPRHVALETPEADALEQAQTWDPDASDVDAQAGLDQAREVRLDDE